MGGIFKHAVMQSILTHNASSCSLDAHGRIVAGAEAASTLQQGASWSDEKRQEFLEVISCVPQACQRTPVGLAALEERERSALGRPNILGVGLEDVLLDLHADLQEGGEASWRTP